MNGDGLLSPLFYRLDMPSGSDTSLEKSTAKATVMEAVGHIFCTNGPNWSPDGRHFYMVDTIKNIIMQYDYDA